jgi:hypothetical protein
VLAVRGGVGRNLRATSEDNAAFNKELQFWLKQIVPAKNRSDRR